MSTTNESEQEKRDVEETGGDNSMMTQGDSSRRDHPRSRFDGFDLPTDGCDITDYGLCYIHYAWDPHLRRALQKVYAELGLHRYNLLEGTDYKFSHLESYNMRRNSGAAPYFLTLYATGPDSGAPIPFHALVSEKNICILDVSVCLARPRGSVVKPRVVSDEQPPLCRPSRRLPPWPSSSEMLGQSFYVLNDNEVQNTDWIRVYLDLVHCTCHRGLMQSQLSNFYIDQVAIQSLSGYPPRLDSKNLVVYMVYRDLEKERLRQPCYSKAIVRRLYKESSGSLTFQGKHWSFSEEKVESSGSLTFQGKHWTFSEEKEKKKKKKDKKRFALLKKRLGVCGAWRLGLDVYKKRGIRSSSRTR